MLNVKFLIHNKVFIICIKSSLFLTISIYCSIIFSSLINNYTIVQLDVTVLSNLLTARFSIKHPDIQFTVIFFLTVNDVIPSATLLDDEVPRQCWCSSYIDPLVVVRSKLLVKDLTLFWTGVGVDSNPPPYHIFQNYNNYS